MQNEPESIQNQTKTQFYKQKTDYTSKRNKIYEFYEKCKKSFKVPELRRSEEVGGRSMTGVAPELHRNGPSCAGDAPEINFLLTCC